MAAMISAIKIGTVAVALAAGGGTQHATTKPPAFCRRRSLRAY